MNENVIIGGGIIGLSIAYELAKRGQSVVVLERDQTGQKASWAGAGIITPANAATAIHPLEQLEAISHELHESWSAELLASTGIDNGFRKCGGLHIARTVGELAALAGSMSDWTQRQIEFEPWDQAQTRERHPFLNDADIRKSVWVPGESQFCNPDHVQALAQACRLLGVTIKERIGEVSLECSGARIQLAKYANESFSSKRFFIAAGPWSEQILKPTHVVLPMQPVRGQIVLYQVPTELGSTADWPIVNEGTRYLVPRHDGHVIAGATIEEVGFDCRTTASEIADLRGWAEGMSSFLNESTFVKSWAGLRPGTYDGFPYLGQLGRFENGFVATGHFKSGLHLSTGTAVVMADLAEGKTPKIDLRPFSPNRVVH